MALLDPEEEELEHLMDRVISSAFSSVDEDGNQSYEAASAARPPFVVPKCVGRYAIAGLIGQGGVGVVLRAQDSELGRDLAVKVMRAEYQNDADMRSQFLEEARITSRLQHPGIVPVYEIGETKDLGPYFTMKVVEGNNLASLLDAREVGELQSQRFLHIFEKICDAIAFAHDKGIVHRDLKPGNIMVGAFGEVQVVDWGFAGRSPNQVPYQSSRGSSAHKESTSIRVMGTPAYMSPEQARNKSSLVDERTDVFALGAILCEILSGAPPYLAETRHEVYLKASQAWLDDAFTRLDAVDADDSLMSIVKACLSVDAAERPRNAAAVAKQVHHYLADQEKQRRALQVEAAQSEARVREAHRARHQERRLRIRTLLLAIVGGIALVAVAIGIWAESRRQAEAWESEQSVNRALDRANVLAERAEDGSPANTSAWEQALVAAEQAALVADGQRIPNELAAKVRSAFADIAAKSERAQRDRDFIAWQEGSSLRADYDDRRPGLEHRFLEAFRNWGVELGAAASVSQAAGPIKSSAIRNELLSGLDDLANDLRRRKIAHPPWRRVLGIAMAADAHEWSNDVRRAYRDDDVERLRGLAASPESGTSAGTLNLVASGLHRLGDPEAAIRFQSLALDLHPQSYRLVHDLEAALGGMAGTDAERILGLARAGVALRPNSSHAWYHLGSGYLRVFDFESAERAYARAEDLDSSKGFKSGLARAARFVADGRDLEALRSIQRSLSGDGRNRLARVYSARVLYRLQDPNAANAQYGHLEKLNTRERFNLALNKSLGGQFDSALAILRKLQSELGDETERLLKRTNLLVTKLHRAIDEVVTLNESPTELFQLTPLEKARIATVALLKGRPMQALQLFESAFAEQPGVGRYHFPLYQATYHSFAAQAAVQVATVEGRNQSDLIANRPSARLNQALAWLQIELSELQRASGSSTKQATLRRRLARLLHTPALAPVRSGRGLDKSVPASAQAHWQAFWQEVRERYKAAE